MSIYSQLRSESFVFQLDLINNTNNVNGGDQYHFGTWFYLDF